MAFSFKCFAYLTFGACVSISNATQMSNLYATDGDTKVFVIWESGITSWPVDNPSGSPVFAINKTVKNAYRSGPGQEYSLSGEALGRTYPPLNTVFDGVNVDSDGLNGSFLDGATDGTFNYAMSHHFNGGMIYRFDAEWGSRELLFKTGYRNDMGITYDNITNTIWVSSSGLQGVDDDENFNSLRNYDMNGNELHSIDLSNLGYRHGGLAMDYVTETLWLSVDSSLVEFSRSGEILRTIDSGNPYRFVGMESDFSNASSVPEPSSVAMFVIGILGIGFAVRSRKA